MARNMTTTSRCFCLPHSMHRIVTPAVVLLLLLSIFYLERHFVVILNQQQLYGHGNRSLLTTNSTGQIEINVTSCTECDHVFYNRIPKTGSEYLLTIFKALARLNKFTFTDNRERYPFEPFTYPNDEEKMDFVKKFLHTKTPVLYAKHLYFIDFDGLDLNQTVTYINVVRDPLERFISYYNYMRFRRDRYHKMSPKRRYMTIDQCIFGEDPECTDELHTMTIVTFFCGSDPVCSKRGPDAVQRAKDNIDRHYIAVGLLEQLREFFMVLEQYLPDYFKGIVRYHDIMRSRRKGKTNVTKWITKPSVNATLVLQNSLKQEFDLYDFIRQRFNKQLSEIPISIRNMKPRPFWAPINMSFSRMNGIKKSVKDIHPPHLSTSRHHTHKVVSVGTKYIRKSPGPTYKTPKAKIG